MKITNLAIVAHIDHGKTTLSKKLIEAFYNKNIQIESIDDLSVEKEKGITVRSQCYLLYQDKNHIVNLIDTPGHIEFKNQVIKFINIVNVVLLLIDPVEGLKCQTEAYLKEIQNKKIDYFIVYTKIDRIKDKDVLQERINNINKEVNYHKKYYLTSSYQNIGFDDIVSDIINLNTVKLEGSNNKLLNITEGGMGTLVGTCYFAKGTSTKLEGVYFANIKKPIKIIYTYRKTPFNQIKINQIYDGDIVNIVFHIKNINLLNGDKFELKPFKEDISNFSSASKIVVFSIFPVNVESLKNLSDKLLLLCHLDSISIEPIFHQTFGGGFEVYCSGAMYIEILKERLLSEFDIETFTDLPQVVYTFTVNHKGKEISTQRPYWLNLKRIDGNITEVKEPFVKTNISVKILPHLTEYQTLAMLKDTYRAEIINSYSNSFDMFEIELFLPISVMNATFFQRMMNMYSGYFSAITDNIIEYKPINFVKVTFSVHTTFVDSFENVIEFSCAKEYVDRVVNILKESSSECLFSYAIRGYVNNRCIKSVAVKAYRKDVTQHLYGGDFTRKQKLLRKQSEGKKVQKQKGLVFVDRNSLVKVLKKTK